MEKQTKSQSFIDTQGRHVTIRKKIRESTRGQIQSFAKTCGITATRTYINNTGVDITVAERNGIKQTVESNITSNEKEFIAKTTYNISQDSYKNLSVLFTTVHDTDTTDLSVFKKAFIASNENAPIVGNSATIISTESSVTLDELIKAGSNLYLVEADVLVSTGTIKTAGSHPFSDTSLFNTSLDNILLENKSSFALQIDIVDNDKVVGNRFIKILNEVRTIIPCKCTRRTNGVFVVTRESGHVDAPTRELHTHTFSLDSLESVGLYKTKEEALTGGDIRLGKAEDLAKLEHDNLMLKKELQLEKTRIDATISENKIAMEKFETELRRESLIRDREHKIELDRMALDKAVNDNRLDSNRQQTKDHYEDRSHQRKDSSEVIKYLPAAVIGIGGLAYAGVKLFGNPVSSISSLLEFW